MTKLIIRDNISPISAANSRLLLLGQYRRLQRSRAVPTTAAFVDCLNLSTFSRNLAQYRPYTKPIITFTMASSSKNRRAKEVKKTRIRHSIGPFLRRKQVLVAKVWARIGCQELATDLRQYFCRCWASVGTHLTSHLRIYRKVNSLLKWFFFNYL